MQILKKHPPKWSFLKNSGLTVFVGTAATEVLRKRQRHYLILCVTIDVKNVLHMFHKSKMTDYHFGYVCSELLGLLACLQGNLALPHHYGETRR